jgi:hypothetical protein
MQSRLIRELETWLRRINESGADAPARDLRGDPYASSLQSACTVKKNPYFYKPYREYVFRGQRL